MCSITLCVCVCRAALAEGNCDMIRQSGKISRPAPFLGGGRGRALYEAPIQLCALRPFLRWAASQNCRWVMMVRFSHLARPRCPLLCVQQVYCMALY